MPPDKTRRRLVRTLSFGAFANPYAIVAVPLAIILIGHLVAGASRALAAEWTAHRVFACTACIAGVAIFTVLAVGHGVLVIVEAWRGNSNSVSR
jgi:hypothetical protein